MRSDMMFNEWTENNNLIDLLVESESKEYESIEEYVRFNDRGVLTKVVINNEIFLVMHKKYVNYREFHKRLVELYKSNNYENKGYARISAEKLLKYRTFVSIVTSYFLKTNGNGELSPSDLAKWFYVYNNQNLEWNQKVEDEK